MAAMAALHSSFTSFSLSSNSFLGQCFSSPSLNAVKDYDIVVNRFLSIEIHELFEELINIESGKESRNITTSTYRKFNLDGNMKLQVVVSAPTSGSISEIDMQVKTVLDPCEDENDDLQDNDVSLGVDFVQRDEHSESDSEISSRIVMIMDGMVDEGDNDP
ncbi:Meiosis-specific protein ASY1 [Camellia lanceoleosa]|uniref:Meiosis-specific protein ASY1 n=1 Tax=Camellia lanceoleosa TaxID=1840588 RepID=A0ACC0FIH4_9ERIC|nr:Meiosis-specific protein ASY1 [Camellia lanceoleosa]